MMREAEKNNNRDKRKPNQTFRLRLSIFACCAFILAMAGPCLGIHEGAGDLVCGGCHTMHNSQGNAGLGGNSGGSMLLLRGPITVLTDAGGGNVLTVHKLCLQCHATNGAQADTAHQPHGQQAPKVFIDSSFQQWDETMPFGVIGAGGNFYPELDDNWNPDPNGKFGLGKGHSVGSAEIQGAPGAKVCCWVQPQCTMCHSPHGRAAYDPYPGINAYRNLTWPFGMISIPAMKSWVGGVTGTYATGGNYVPVNGVGGAKVWPVYKLDPTVPANNNAYDPRITWLCAGCHGKFHEYTEPANQTGEDWKRHPAGGFTNTATLAGYKIKDSDVSGNGTDTIDMAHYNSIPDGYKLPVASGGAAATEVYYMNNDDEDRVFCLTCHFVHGGPYYDNLRWDYASPVSPGSQTGKAIISTRGCQQCHNR